MKGYIAKKRFNQLKLDADKYWHAVTIQKYLRRVLAKNKIDDMRVEVGAAIMIQSFYKGFKVRK
jgi:hypothetical protein